MSWCKFEVFVDSPKDIQVLTSSKNIVEIPPVVVTAINLKTITNEKQNLNEIVSASVICCHKAKVDSEGAYFLILQHYWNWRLIHLVTGMNNNVV